MDVDFGQAGFGIEQCPPPGTADGTTVNGVLVTEASPGNFIFTGALPSATMEIRGEDTYDGYNSKLIYAVSANLTVPGSVIDKDPAGFITVFDSENSSGALTQINNVPFVIVSTGRNGVRSTLNALTASDGDLENMDGDGIFHNFVGHSTVTGDFYYDDELLYSLTKTDPEYCVPNKLDVQSFSTSGIWTKPPGFLYAEVVANGAGGGAGNCTSNGSCADSDCNAIGGGGAFTRTLFNDEGLPATVNVTIGIGGENACTRAGNAISCLSGFARVGNSSRMYYEGRDATETSFGTFIVLPGGQGATIQGGPARTVAGIPGTATGGDVYTPGTAGGGGRPNHTFISQSAGCGGGTSWEEGHYVDGSGADGSVTVTSYICE